MASKSIGALVAGLTLNNKAFKAGIKDSMKDSKLFGMSLKKVAALGAGIGAAIGVAKVAGELKELTSLGFETGDAMSKLSDTVGISTESLVGLTKSAGLAGASQEQAVNAISKFQIALGQAKNGSKGMQEAFQGLGLSMSDLEGLSPEQAFYRVSDSIASIQDPMQRAAMGSRVFGEEYKKLDVWLGSGSKGMKDATEEAKLFGTSLSRVDGAQIEMANDAMSRLTDVFLGIGQQIAIHVAPAITWIAEGVTDFVKRVGGIPKIVNWVAQAVGKAISFVANWAEGFIFVWKYGQKYTLVFFKGIMDGIAWIQNAMVSALQWMQSAWRNAFAWILDKVLVPFIAFYEKIWAKLGVELDISGSLDKLSQRLKEEAEYISGLDPSFDSWANKVSDRLGSAIDKVNDEIDDRLDAPRWGDKIETMFARMDKRAEAIAEAAGARNAAPTMQAPEPEEKKKTSTSELKQQAAQFASAIVAGSADALRLQSRQGPERQQLQLAQQSKQLLELLNGKWGYANKLLEKIASNAVEVWGGAA